MRKLIYLFIIAFLFPVSEAKPANGNSLSLIPPMAGPTSSANLSSRDIVTGMLGAIDKTKTLQFTFKSYERLKGGKNFYTEMETKVSLSPLKIYALTNSDPNKGVEVLYLHGNWDNKAMVNPGNWLPNVKLSPFGDRMRENQHHTLLDSGFGLLAGIIRNAIKRADTERPGEFDTYCRNDGDITWQGRECYKITIDDPTFTYVEYTVKEGDDVDKIAHRNFICGYLILEKNPTVKDWGSLKPGMKIKLPSSYAKKTVLYVDKQSYLPVVQIMYDEVGEFEKYEFHNLRVNPAFKDNEFTPDFEGYDF